MDNEILKSEAPSPSKKDHLLSEDMTTVKTLAHSKKRNNLTFNLIFSNAVQQCDKSTKSFEDSTSKSSSSYRVGFLVVTVLTFAAGFGLGWWCANFNPDMSASKLNTEPFTSMNS